MASSSNNLFDGDTLNNNSTTPSKVNKDTSSCSSISDNLVKSSLKKTGKATPENKKKRSPKSYRAPLPSAAKSSQTSSGIMLDLPTVSITEPTKESTPENVESIELETFTKETRSLTNCSFSSISSSNTTTSSTSNNKLRPVLKVTIVDEGAESDIEPSSGSISSYIESNSPDSKKSKKKRKFKNLTLSKKKINSNKRKGE